MFEVKQISAHAWEFLDASQASFYLIIGGHTAAVIDTGVTYNAQILPEIRKIASLPVVLVITHAHYDHMYHKDEFDTVYMCHDELQMPLERLQGFMMGKQLDLNDTIDIRTGSCIDLGGRTLEICLVPGHTPGSVAVWEKEEDLLFTGDAIGSGCGVWMQVPGGLTVAQYAESLRFFLRWLVERGGRMCFFGGHNRQPWQSKKVPGWNPLSLGLLADMIDLAEGVANGTIVGEPCDAKSFTDQPALYAAFGRAEIIFDSERIK